LKNKIIVTVITRLAMCTVQTLAVHNV